MQAAKSHGILSDAKERIRMGEFTTLLFLCAMLGFCFLLCKMEIIHLYPKLVWRYEITNVEHGWVHSIESAKYAPS